MPGRGRSLTSYPGGKSSKNNKKQQKENKNRTRWKPLHESHHHPGSCLLTIVQHVQNWTGGLSILFGARPALPSTTTGRFRSTRGADCTHCAMRSNEFTSREGRDDNHHDIVVITFVFAAGGGQKIKSKWAFSEENVRQSRVILVVADASSLLTMTLTSASSFWMELSLDSYR